MTVNNKNTTIKEEIDKGNFMLPIWIITLATMIGTGLISYSVHLYKISKQHSANQAQIDTVEFRTKKYTEYKNLIEKEGLEIAVKSLNK